MTRALHSVVALGLVALVLSPAAAHAQAPGQAKSQTQPKAQAASSLAPSAQMPRADERPISVEYYNVPLRDAVRRLAAFSGRTIDMDSDLGNPVLNESIANVHWRRVLDIVLEGQGLIARDDKSGVIRIERRARGGKES